MADEPIYQDLLDDSEIDTSAVFDSELFTDKQFMNWVNNQTRLNAFNMNNLNALIQSYGSWIGKTTVEYLNNGTLKKIIENNAGWSAKLNGGKGEVFSDYLNNTANGEYSSAFGENNSAESGHQFVIGKFGTPNPDAVFAVGWGESKEDRKNIFTILQDGRAQTEASPTEPQDLVNKQHLDTELERVKQLNQWIGNLSVTSEEFDLANNNVKLKPLLTQFVETNSPAKREPRNGDIVTVTISDKQPTDPQYPELWIFLETDPAKPGEHTGDWYFYSSQQELLNASKDVKGLVQIGDNINVNNGLVSVPVATDTILGVIKNGKTIINNQGTIDVNTGENIVTGQDGKIGVPVGTSDTFGVLKTGKTITNNSGTIDVKTSEGFEVAEDGTIRIKNATKDTLGVVSIGDNINVEEGKISSPLASTDVFGVVKAGSNVTIEEGTISVPIATNSSPGVVQVGENITLQDSTISVTKATKDSVGLVSIGDNISVDDGKISVTADNIESALGYVPASSAEFNNKIVQEIGDSEVKIPSQKAWTENSAVVHPNKVVSPGETIEDIDYYEYGIYTLTYSGNGRADLRGFPSDPLLVNDSQWEIIVVNEGDSAAGASAPIVHNMYVINTINETVNHYQKLVTPNNNFQRATWKIINDVIPSLAIVENPSSESTVSASYINDSCFNRRPTATLNDTLTPEDYTEFGIYGINGSKLSEKNTKYPNSKTIYSRNYNGILINFKSFEENIGMQIFAVNNGNQNFEIFYKNINFSNPSDQTNISQWDSLTFHITDYVLPVASENDLGGVKVGEGLSIDGNGVLSAPPVPITWSDL